MKYTLEIDIAAPRARVIELFDNTDNLAKWQPGFVSLEHLGGEPGQEGARSRLRYLNGKREVELIETVTRRNLPDEFVGTYETKGVWNEVANRFEEAGPDRTRWVSDVEFRMSGVYRIMGALMPFMFKKQSFDFMKRFKAFAESETAG